MTTSQPFALSAHPALLIVDMQNGFVHPNGTLGKLGWNVSPLVAPIPHIRRLIDLFERKNLPIIFFRLSFADDSYADAGIILDRRPQIKKIKGLLRGTWDVEIIDELRPDGQSENVMVIDKTRNTAFFRTELDDKLKELGVDQVIVTGVGTNVCVEATVRDAFTYGYPPIVVREATATLEDDAQQASLKNMGDSFGEVRGVDEVVAALGG